MAARDQSRDGCDGVKVRVKRSLARDSHYTSSRINCTRECKLVTVIILSLLFTAITHLALETLEVMLR